MATEKHQVLPSGFDELQKLFLDLDLSVLGKSNQAYLLYAAAIREEYEHVPASVYCEKRAEILTKFLEKDRLYFTAVFHREMEEQARRNLQVEIEMLRDGRIPSPPPVVNK